MNPYPKIQLSRIRQIGWDHWDPIGIRSFGTDGWKEGAADEYDAYLLQVVGKLHRGEPIESAISYLEVSVLCEPLSGRGTPFFEQFLSGSEVLPLSPGG